MWLFSLDSAVGAITRDSAIAAVAAAHVHSLTEAQSGWLSMLNHDSGLQEAPDAQSRPVAIAGGKEYGLMQSVQRLYEV